MTCPQWDLFCRVVDNHGDVGVCWRLAADLASRGQAVRLWIDDASALAWMAPHGAPGVQVLPWPADPGAEWAEAPPDRVVEAFGCELPAPCLRHMAKMAVVAQAPVWINLEYLSAEGFVERSHGLPSPQSSGAAIGLRKWFFFPGFTDCTGGLIREPALEERQRSFDRTAWLRVHGVAPLPHQPHQPHEPAERVVSLFCYAQPALSAWLDALSATSTLLLVTPGPAARQVHRLLGPCLRRGHLRAVMLPWLTQPAYDELLWACDLNLVRGEDSFVRAQWAAKPFVWQPYTQQDGAHLAKLDAFMGLFSAAAEPEVADALWRFSSAWAGGGGGGGGTLPDLPSTLPESPWRLACGAWREALRAQSDLTTRLIRFASEAG